MKTRIRTALTGGIVLAATVVLMAAGPRSWSAATEVPPAAVGALDLLLDLYVRDGFVYYAALKLERSQLDRYLAAIAEEPVDFDSWEPDARVALWLNAYNGLVLRTVVDHYPIRGQSPRYPPDSIRQVPGAFDRQRHRIVGREVTLDEIEQTIFPQFGDPRLFLAIGRGAVGSGRLRSEAYRSDRLEMQLSSVVEEFATTPRHVLLDQIGEALWVSAIFGWREPDFEAAYSEQGWTDSGRTAIERAILTLISPVLFSSEREFFTENRFTLRYQEFDWRLNDLTGGRP